MIKIPISSKRQRSRIQRQDRQNLMLMMQIDLRSRRPYEVKILDKIKGKAQSGILKKIRKIVGGGVLVDSRKGVKAIQDCISYHKIIKEEYKKIK